MTMGVRAAMQAQISSTMMVSWPMAMWGPWVSIQPAGSIRGCP